MVMGESQAILSFPATVAFVKIFWGGLDSLICSSCACKNPSGEPAALTFSGDPEGSSDTAAIKKDQISCYRR